MLLIPVDRPFESTFEKCIAHCLFILKSVKPDQLGQQVKDSGSTYVLSEVRRQRTPFIIQEYLFECPKRREVRLPGRRVVREQHPKKRVELVAFGSAYFVHHPGL